MKTVIGGSCHKYNFSRDKHMTKHVFCRNKSMHVFCRDKHTFVATKIILVAAPANDGRVSVEIA